ncbi:protein kinase-like protein [Mycoplasmopsis mustelae]|uniref:Protein kinase-like protein n=1 Tax=Mycoplasmopsis mustelae TaxID=171289 RepID=A0A4R7UES6_9BACT|nr:hypothetical protein [Mycoplasmopsis mustelae]TDV24421.1 protein kinase-like protein [Mycoplasmopsis mustelae]
MSLKIKDFSYLFNKKWEITNNGDFLSFIYEKTKLPENGWKIHISAILVNYKQILNIVVCFCKQHKMTFKYIKDYKEFQNTLTQKKINNLTGKFITIYPINEKQAKFIILNLYSLLKGFSGPLTYSDKQYKNSIIHYRWGSITTYNENDYKTIIKKYKPDYIDDLFKTKNLNKSKKEFKGYQIIGIIYFDSYSNIWLTKKANLFYIIKESKRHFRFDKNIENRKKEFLISKLINSEYLPKAIEHFYNKQSYFFVYEFCPGTTLEKFKESISLLFDTKQSKYDLAHKLLNHNTKLIKFINDNNLILNDIKASNFIYNQIDDKLTFIDLEHSFIYSNKKRKLINKEIISQYYNPRQLNLKNDQLKLFYMLLDLFFDIKSNFYTIHFRKYISFIMYVNKDIQLFKVVLRLFKIFKKRFSPANINEIFNQPLIQKLLFDNKKVIFSNNNLTISEIFETLNKNLLSSNFIFKYYLMTVIDSHNFETIKNLIQNTIIDKELSKVSVNGTYNNDYSYSPYINNGTAGLIYIFLFIKFKFNINIYDENIIKLIIPLLNVFTRKIGIANGYAGLLIIKYLYFKLFDKSCENLKNELSFILFATKNNYVYDYDNNKIDESFLNGYQGLQFLYHVLVK